jgi:hypothetical protein
MKILGLFLTALSLQTLPALPDTVGSDVFIEDKAAGSLVVWQDMTVPENKDYKSVVVMNGDLEFFGRTDHMVLVNGSLKLQEGSEVREKLVIISGKIEQSDGAIIPGEGPSVSWNKEFHFDYKWPWFERWKSGWMDHSFFKILWIPLFIAIPLAFLVLLFGLALLFFAMAPALSQFADEDIRRNPLACLGFGAVGYLCILPAIVLLCITIVGIPFIPLFVLFIMLVLLAGFFAISRTLGQALLSKIGFGKNSLSTLLGLLIMFALSFTPILGRFIVLGLLMVGAGAILRSKVSGRTY